MRATIEHDFLRAALMCGLDLDSRGVHQHQLFYCIFKVIGRIALVESLQRRIETAANKGDFWIRTSEGVYALTSRGQQEARARFPSQQQLMPRVEPKDVSFVARSPLLTDSEAVEVVNLGGSLSVTIGGRLVKGREACVWIASVTGEPPRDSSRAAPRQVLNYGIKRGWLLEWNGVWLEGEIENESEPGLSPRRKVERLVAVREQQARFRQNLLEAYNGSCCVSKETVCDVLEAAHILPYANGGGDGINNGLLLRADIHRLFDADLLRVDPSTWTIVAHEKLAGSLCYQELNGSPVQLPMNVALRPDAAAFVARAAEHRTQYTWKSLSNGSPICSGQAL